MGFSEQKGVSIAPTAWTRPNCASPFASTADRRSSSSYTDGSRSRRSTEPGRGGERVPRERARLVDVTRGRNSRHDVRSAAESGQRQAAADDLPQHGEVGQDAEPLLRAAAGDPEAGDHLVEDEERAGVVARRPQRLQEPRLGRNDAHVSRHWLDHDRGEALAVPLDGRGDGAVVVVGADDRVGGRASRHAGQAGMPSVANPEPASASSASAWPW